MEQWEKKPHSCNICGKEFVLSVTFKAHMVLHQRESPYSCTWCGEVFAQKNSLALKNHMRHHLDMLELNKKVKEVGDKYAKKPKGSLYMCKIRDRTLSSKYALIKHLMLQKGEKSMDCEICNKKYFNKRSLKAHMQKCHTDDEPTYVCEVCGIAFKRKYLLDRHFQGHKNSMLYYCNECKRPYRSKKVLTHHLKTHTAEVRRKSILVNSDVENEPRANENGTEPVKVGVCQSCGSPVTSHDSSLPNSGSEHGVNSSSTCSTCDKNEKADNTVDGNVDKEDFLNSSIVCEALENKEKITLYIKEDDFSLGRITKDREDCIFEEQGHETKVISKTDRLDTVKKDDILVIDADLALGVEEVIIDKDYVNINAEAILQS